MMLNHPTLDKLRTLRLAGMSQALEEQLKDASMSDLSFEDRLGLLVEAESLYRQNRRRDRLLKAAHLRIGGACLEDLDYASGRGLNKKLMQELRSCQYIEYRQSVLISGKTGVGKTYLACALVEQACRRGLKGQYMRASRLFDELRLARADGSYQRLLSRLGKLDVLAIDDFGLQPLSVSARSDLLEVVEERYDRGSTIISSQLPPDKWHAYLEEPTMADAICDRLLHNAHQIALKGKSRR